MKKSDKSKKHTDYNSELDTTPFWEKPIQKLTQNEWESLCDGCGLCCIEKLEDDNKIYYTRVACELLDTNTGKCKNYAERKDIVSDCIKLTIRNIDMIDWLPDSCAYILRANNEPLPKWHPLLDTKEQYQNEHPRKLFNEHEFVLENTLKQNENLANYLLISDKLRK